MKKYCVLFLSIIIGITTLVAQTTPKKVLFLGNSYTAFNNLPDIVSSIASANGDSIIYQAITPGGQYLLVHSNDMQVITAFQQGDWDYIVVQEQSQIPVIPYYRENLMFPGALNLKNLRDQHSPSANMFFFMTWGRQNGGQQCNGAYCSHPFIGFTDYQDTLTWAYQQTAAQTSCGIAPVGEIWREVILQHQISMPPLSLFSTDGSHPSQEGSYLAALTIYSTLFNKPVSNLYYSYGGIDPVLDTFFKQITDANLWPRYIEWHLDVMTANAQNKTLPLLPIIYPNPVTDALNIITEAPFLFVEICDIFGSIHMISKTNSVNTSTLKRGVYIARFHFEDMIYSRRFVVQ